MDIRGKIKANAKTIKLPGYGREQLSEATALPLS